jgi:hypothetical protein
MITLPCLGESLVHKLIEVHPWISLVALLADLSDEKSQKTIEINLDVNLGNEW